SCRWRKRRHPPRESSDEHAHPAARRCLRLRRRHERDEGRSAASRDRADAAAGRPGSRAGSAACARSRRATPCDYRRETRRHRGPLVAVDIRFFHGVDADPADRPGLAEFVADTVDEGTKTRSAEKFAEQVENLAAHLGAGAALEGSSAHLNCLSETLPDALELFADMIQNPAFRAEDVERVRVLRLTGLEQKRANLGALASDEADRILFGPEHPWGKPSGGTPESVAAITPAELTAFTARWGVPNNASVTVFRH